MREPIRCVLGRRRKKPQIADFPTVTNQEVPNVISSSSSTASSGGVGEAGLISDPALRASPTPADLASVLPWPDEPATDGRLARGQRTRRNVADGLVALLREGDPEPTARDVARRAGVSLRLVFHHFADLDDLYAFVAALEFRRQWSETPQPLP